MDRETRDVSYRDRATVAYRLADTGASTGSAKNFPRVVGTVAARSTGSGQR